MGEIIDWAGRDRPAPLAGITAAVAIGDQLSAVRYTLEPGAPVPEHSHPNEEFGQVLRGSLELRWAGQTRVLTAGEAFLLPGGVPHAARALDGGCELLECYAPPRDPLPPTGSTGGTS
jgi:quercetin dioxygenase-like cupin family protein